MLIKKIAQISLILFLCGVLAFTSFSIWRTQTDLDLNATTKLTGIVTFAQEAVRRSESYSKAGSSTKVFALKLDTTADTLGTYNSSNDYTFLKKSIRLGDTITVFYNPNSHVAINVDVYQIEKKNRIIVDYKNYNRNHKTAAIIIAILAGFILIIGCMAVLSPKKLKAV